MTSSTSINILSNALYDKKEELTDKEYFDTYQLLTVMNNVNNNVNNNVVNNNREILRNNIFVATIIIINFLLGLFIYITFNQIITHTCKNQVTILNNILDTCNNITQPYSFIETAQTFSLYFNKNKCDYKIYYCNHIINKMNTYDNLCMPIVSTCFKQINITRYNIIRIIISVYCSILLGIALRIIVGILRKFIYPINRTKYIIYLLCLCVISFTLLIIGMMNNNKTIIFISIGLFYFLTFSLIMYKYIFM